jgi:TolB-like protein/Flp pilus assembly protein TadD
MSSTASDFQGSLAQRAVFLSYAREDTAAAQRIADALRTHGVEVWFDQSELRGGDVWDQKIRRQIKECALFVPIISGKTQARGEGYFRLEWKLAVERTHLMAEGVPFLAPVVVDETLENSAIVPAEFLRVQWIRLPGSLPTPQFVAQVKRMMEAPGQVAVSAPRTATGSVPQASGSKTVAIVAAAAVLIAVLATVVIMRRPSVPATAPAAAPAVASAAPAAAAAPADAVDPKSIAVLPFENMSQDKDNAFFSDGVHEDVLTNLSFIKDLHVVSRTSVMQYRDTTKSIKQIGKELGVAYVLEGSVRREGNKVRVTGQLIDARTDEHVWAKAYDRDLNDIFAIQGELAQAIADALQSVLSPETKELLARRPTENTEAYDDFLKARALRASADIMQENKALELLEAAVRLDPNFAQAWAELGSRRAFAMFGDVQTEEQVRLAKEAIDTAVRLAPDDPVVIEGEGDYYYYCHRDYARATEQYMRLEQLRPNDPIVFASLGLIQRRQGRFADAISNLRLAARLDPKNVSYQNSLYDTLGAMRRYDEVLAAERKFCAEHPDDLQQAFNYAFTLFSSNGSIDEIRALLSRSVDEKDKKFLLLMKKSVAAGFGDWPEFARIDRELRTFDGLSQDPTWNQDANSAEIFAESGDMAAARARAAEALATMKQVLVTQPDNAQLWSDMGMDQAILGDKEEALASIRKATELLPESRDAVLGPGISQNCAYALMWAGEKERALAEFSRLLHVPFGVNIYFLRHSCGPLKDDPRFKEMIGNLQNNAPIL